MEPNDSGDGEASEKSDLPDDQNYSDDDVGYGHDMMWLGNCARICALIQHSLLLMQ